MNAIDQMASMAEVENKRARATWGRGSHVTTQSDERRDKALRLLKDGIPRTAKQVGGELGMSHQTCFSMLKILAKNGKVRKFDVRPAALWKIAPERKVKIKLGSR